MGSVRTVDLDPLLRILIIKKTNPKVFLLAHSKAESILFPLTPLHYYLSTLIDLKAHCLNLFLLWLTHYPLSYHCRKPSTFISAELTHCEKKSVQHHLHSWTIDTLSNAIFVPHYILPSYNGITDGSHSSAQSPTQSTQYMRPCELHVARLQMQTLPTRVCE